MVRVFKNLAALCVIIMSVACDENAVYHDYKSLSGVWHKDSSAVFQVNEIDTLQSHDLFVMVRNDNQYPFSNLFLFTEMQFPNGRIITDTLEYEMAEPNGTWLGTGFGDVKENKLWYKEGVRFNEKGTYTFYIKQLMRRNGEVAPITVLEGIRDVGLRIETSND